MKVWMIVGKNVLDILIRVPLFWNNIFRQDNQQGHSVAMNIIGFSFRGVFTIIHVVNEFVLLTTFLNLTNLSKRSLKLKHVKVVFPGNSWTEVISVLRCESKYRWPFVMVKNILYII